MLTVTSIIEKIRTAPALDFGNIFSRSIELFKQTWLQGFLMQLFIMILISPFIIIIYVPLIMAMITQQESGQYDPNALDGIFAGLSLIYIVVLIAAFVVVTAVSVCLQAAFYRIMKKIDHGETTTTSDFFYFMKINYLGKAFVLMLVSSIIAIIAALLCYLPLFYAMVPLTFFTVFFAYNPDFSVGDIVSLSFRLGTKKWLIGFGLLIVASLLAQIVGLLLCGIGVLFTSAFVYHPTYFIYKDVVGFEESSEIDTIGNQAVE